MSDATPPLDGGCRCGQVRFRLTAPPALTMTCHCRGCQQMTGGPYSVSTMVWEAGFKLTAGEPVIGGLHGPDVQHFHCAHCMSWVFTRPSVAPIVNVRTTMLDEPAGLAPFVDCYVSEKLPWVAVVSERTYAQFPADGEWPALMGAYGARAGQS